MNKKSFIIIPIFIILIIVLLKSIGTELNREVQEDDKQAYFDAQKERITLYMKYNLKNYKNITFTDAYRHPMDGYVIKGYINDNKKLHFTITMTSKTMYDFEKDLSGSEELLRNFKENKKAVSEIKEALEANSLQ